MPSNQVPDIEQPSSSSGRSQAGTTKRGKRKSAGKDAGNHSKKQKIERRTESESESDQNRAEKAEDKEQSTLDETADETPRDDKEATEDDEVEIEDVVKSKKRKVGKPF